MAQKSVLLLRFDGGAWLELGRSGEQAPSHQYFGNPTGTVAAATFAAIVAADLPTAGTFTLASVTQSTGLSFTTQVARFSQFGKTVVVNGFWTITQAGTSSNIITVALPAGLAALGSYSGGQCLGTYNYLRVSGVQWSGGVYMSGATALNFLAGGGLTWLGLNPTFATASGDAFSVALSYEVA